jgi:hypothetical protein
MEPRAPTQDPGDTKMGSRNFFCRIPLLFKHVLEVHFARGPGGDRCSQVPNFQFNSTPNGMSVTPLRLGWQCFVALPQQCLKRSMLLSHISGGATDILMIHRNPGWRNSNP